MSDEEHRSSFVSIAGGGRPQVELQVPASGLVQGHEQPLPSIEPGTINNLPQPTACNYFIGRRKLSNAGQKRASVSTSDHA
jgi:hypothetical protein